MHVDRENKSAKFWLDPVVPLADNYGYNGLALVAFGVLGIETESGR